MGFLHMRDNEELDTLVVINDGTRVVLMLRLL